MRLRPLMTAPVSIRRPTDEEGALTPVRIVLASTSAETRSRAPAPFTINVSAGPDSEPVWRMMAVVSMSSSPVLARMISGPIKGAPSLLTVMRFVRTETVVLSTPSVRVPPISRLSAPKRLSCDALSTITPGTCGVALLPMVIAEALVMSTMPPRPLPTGRAST